MKKTQPKSTRLMMWIISGLVTLMFLGVVLGAIKLLLSDDGEKRRRQVRMVTLVKPPPPPKIKEKPPEPEIEKKQEIIEQPQEEPEPEPMDDMSDENASMDDNLGLDAEGTGGADGFGLRAKKGGRALIGGSQGSASLLRRYGWYTAIIQDELRKKINKYMEENGGVPDGNLKAMVKIKVDDFGKIIDFSLLKTSGNKNLDQAVLEALKVSALSEPPPVGMPRTLQLKVSAKG